MGLKDQSWFNPSGDEDVLWYSNPSFVMRLPDISAGFIVAVIALIAALYMYFQTNIPMEVIWVAILIVPVGLFFGSWRLLIYKNTFYVITSHRVIQKRGILGRRSSSKPFTEIVRTDVNITPFEAILSRLSSDNIGDIIVRTADDTGAEFVLEHVPEISKAEAYLERLTGQTPDSPAAPTTDLSPDRSPSSHPDGRSSNPSSTRGNPQSTESSTTEHSNEQEHNTTPSAPEPDEEVDPFEPSDSA